MKKSGSRYARAVRLLGLPFLAAGLLSCESVTFESPYWEAVQAELNRRYSLWLTAAPKSYEYRFSRVCACPEDLQREVTVAVTDTTIVGITYRDGSGTVPASSYRSYFTVKGLFQQVQHAINLLADSLYVEYDATLHYPKVIVGDPNRFLEGDELGLFSDSLVAK